VWLCINSLVTSACFSRRETSRERSCWYCVRVSFVEVAMLLLCWFLTSKMVPDVVELICLIAVIALWCTLLYDAVFINAPKEVFWVVRVYIVTWNIDGRRFKARRVGGGVPVMNLLMDATCSPFPCMFYIYLCPCFELSAWYVFWPIL
jgi:hypothetical protein